jgi:hypothetical protein
MTSDIYFEKNLIINGRTITYKGIFRADELFIAINRALEAKGYEKREKKTEEMITEGGKKTIVELRPIKVKTNYVTLMIKILITMDSITETVEVVHGERRKFSQGDLTVIFDAWSLTDYQHRWGMKPFVYFIKGAINKFIYKFPLEGGFTRELSRDTGYMHAQVKELLKSYTAHETKRVSEEDVRKEVERDVLVQNEVEG